SMTAWNSKYKIALLRRAHSMNREAQSAFLKLLEEPKGDALFFLLTEYPDMLFETIRSRAQEFKFYSFSQMQIPGDVTREFQKLQRADLHMRFSYAKNLSDEPECIDDVLRQWISVLRKALHEAARKDSERALPLSRSVSTMQEIQFLLRTTNVGVFAGLLYIW
ncbi:MAG: putative DNA-directed DNA polymerase, partial [Candidatus Kaiserbacteria bacterium GW2011_GWC2_52_8b]